MQYIKCSSAVKAQTTVNEKTADITKMFDHSYLK